MALSLRIITSVSSKINSSSIISSLYLDKKPLGLISLKKSDDIISEYLIGTSPLFCKDSFTNSIPSFSISFVL